MLESDSLVMLRLISRVDIRNGFHIKTTQCEGVKKIQALHTSLYQFGQSGAYEADEIIILDTVASLYQRQNSVTEDGLPYVPIPIVVGGGVRTVDDGRRLIESGSEKVILNSHALQNPELIENLAATLGRQATVLQVDVRRQGDSWICYFNGGREPSGYDVQTWIPLADSLGAGEVFVTSIDNEGTGLGLNLDLLSCINDLTSLPIVAAGGIGSVEDIVRAYQSVTISGVAYSYISNVVGISTTDIRYQLGQYDVPVRRISR